MIQLCPAAKRGAGHYGWLEARYSFSFSDYFDPERMGWGALRVLNEDRIQPGEGFGMHGHRDMEIVTYLISGQLAHEDSLGQKGVLQPGMIQRMSAGSGIRHREFNPDPLEETHLLQIWILPAQRGGVASYEQQDFRDALATGGLIPLATPQGGEGLARLGQDATIYALKNPAGCQLTVPFSPSRLGYVQVISGPLYLNGLLLEAGDGVLISEESALVLSATSAVEFLLFDLPPAASQSMG